MTDTTPGAGGQAGDGDGLVHRAIAAGLLGVDVADLRGYVIIGDTGDGVMIKHTPVTGEGPLVVAGILADVIGMLVRQQPMPEDEDVTVQIGLN